MVRRVVLIFMCLFGWIALFQTSSAQEREEEKLRRIYVDAGKSIVDLLKVAPGRSINFQGRNCQVQYGGEGRGIDERTSDPAVALRGAVVCDGQTVDSFETSVPLSKLATAKMIKDEDGTDACSVDCAASSSCIQFSRTSGGGSPTKQVFHTYKIKYIRDTATICSLISSMVADVDRERAALQQAELDRKKKAIEEKHARKQSALKDCGAEPNIIGGPWFSSTYKIGALDEARRRASGLAGNFLCIKSIEHVSPAVNPMGGSAARARFIGYDRFDFTLRAEVHDFPY